MLRTREIQPKKSENITLTINTMKEPNEIVHKFNRICHIRPLHYRFFQVRVNSSGTMNY